MNSTRRKLVSAAMTTKVCQVGIEQKASEALELMQRYSVSSVDGTAVLASDLDYRISYATPSIAQVLGLRLQDVGGADIRATLKRVGWQGVDASLSEEAVAPGARHYVVATSCGRTDFQVSVLLNAQNEPQGYLVLAPKA